MRKNIMKQLIVFLYMSANCNFMFRNAKELFDATKKLKTNKKKQTNW